MCQLCDRAERQLHVRQSFDITGVNESSDGAAIPRLSSREWYRGCIVIDRNYGPYSTTNNEFVLVSTETIPSKYLSECQCLCYDHGYDSDLSYAYLQSMSYSLYVCIIQGVPRNISKALKETGSYNEDEISGTWLARVVSDSSHFLHVVQLIN